MLRLKPISINPALIDSIVINFKRVIIGTAAPDVQPTVVELKTEEDAIYFAEYVELLVDITNKETIGFREASIINFESYFANYLRPKEIWEDVRQEVQKHLNKGQKAK